MVLNVRLKVKIAVFMLLASFGGQFYMVSAIDSGKNDLIAEHCSVIKDNLKKVQKEDSKVRVYLGRYYEIILSRFITPLNVRLVENNLSTADLVENQNEFADAKALFANDFINYQQSLEDLVNMDCKNDPEEFSDKLDSVRKKRKIMNQDVLKIRNLITQHVRLVEGLKGKV